MFGSDLNVFYSGGASFRRDSAYYDIRLPKLLAVIDIEAFRFGVSQRGNGMKIEIQIKLIPGEFQDFQVAEDDKWLGETVLLN